MSIKVMTWNVENLFKPEAGAEAEYQQKLQGLANVINEQKPTIVAMQEIGHTAALAELLTNLDGSWNSVVSQFPDGRGIRVGFIAQQDLLDQEDIVDLPEQLAPLQVDDQRTVINRVGRGALAVSLKVGNNTLRLVTAHLKSKLLTFPGGRFAPHDEDERARYGTYAMYRRAAEATTVRTYCNHYLAGKGTERLLLLLGDMNDEPQAATTQILTGPLGSEIGSPGELRPDKGDQWRLLNLAPLLPEQENYSRIYRGRRELVDHLLVSRALLSKVDRNSVRALHGAGLPSITDDPTRRPIAEPSDHAPLIASFTLG